MNQVVQLIINSILLGIGLAMDAFSVSIANGLIEPGMKKTRMLKMAGIYALFQFAMPMLGWIFVTSLESVFSMISPLIPWVALILLLFIGGKMIVEAILEKKNGKKEDNKPKEKLTWKLIFVQGVATSIDALSVGFTISMYSLLRAIASSLIIGAVTLVICLIGLISGRKIGGKISGVATIIGGVILILIGIEIFVTGVFNL